MTTEVFKKFAVFDIDGTLIRWQLYHAVVDKLAKSGALGADAEAKLNAARMVWKRREHPEAFKEYEKELIKIYESAFSELEVSKFDAMVQEVIEEYRDQVYTYTRDLIKSLKKQGYILLAISGSHHELVQEIAKYYQFDDFVGSRYGRKGGKFSGMEFLATKDKKNVLEGLVEKHSLSLEGSIAVGDSASDAGMLTMVEQPIAFNPDQTLLDIAKKKGWKIVVERKNVTYELEPGDGRYVLA
jgi:HAD superfamily hydrolase (TIGR01490 family)